MGKRKLTDTTIVEIANSYAKNGDVVTLAYLSSLYHVSTSTISKALHYAILNCLVSEHIANLIAEKAIRHDNIRRELYGYTKNNKVTELYNNLILARTKKEVNISNLQDLISKYDELNHQYNNFDDTFSSSDEYPYTKEELSNVIESISKEIDKIKGHI